MIVCTSICANYIPKAKVLASSLKEHNPGATFVLCLVERTIHPAARDPHLFDHVILASELGIEHFESFMFRHSIVEASTAVKGHLFKELLRRFPGEDQFVYLDPDILVTGPFPELEEVLKSRNIVLTPHLCEPEEDQDAILDNEICALKHGVFNLGFLAVRRSEESGRFIGWWADRLYDYCYADIPGGLFTDQRWIDLAPCFYDVFVFRNPGYNVAPWNLSRRKIRQDSRGAFHVGEAPLRFFHFSGFDSGANEAMVTKYCPDKNDPVFQIRRAYLRLLDKSGQEELGKLPWSYDFYTNGIRIAREHRIVYRDHKDLQSHFGDPFRADAPSPFYVYIKTRRFRSWSSFTAGVKKWVGYALRAYRNGGIGLVIERTLKYIGKRM